MFNYSFDLWFVLNYRKRFAFLRLCENDCRAAKVFRRIILIWFGTMVTERQRSQELDQAESFVKPNRGRIM